MTEQQAKEHVSATEVFRSSRDLLLAAARDRAKAQSMTLLFEATGVDHFPGLTGDKPYVEQISWSAKVTEGRSVGKGNK